jgi:hypothetical protein
MRPDLAVRVSGVAGAFPDGAFPPIDVVQVDQAYFVVDGHKRVAAARRSGVEVIDANVTRLAVAHSVDAATERDDLLLAEAEDRFLGDSGLREARPGVRVSCLSPRAYAELLEAVKAHGTTSCARASDCCRPARWRPTGTTATTCRAPLPRASMASPTS